MLKICFVCLGNICRSPMAEFIMKDKIAKAGLTNEFYIDSKAISPEEEGNRLYYAAREKLKEKNIPYEKHNSTPLFKEDYPKYDYFIGMDINNINCMHKIFTKDPEQKIHLLLSFRDKNREVADPWYTRDFEQAYQDIDLGCKKWLEQLTNQNQGLHL